MIRRQRILYLTNRVPYPPDKGDKIRTYHHLDHLARWHDVYCACFADSPRELDRAEALRQWCTEVAVVRWSPGRALLRTVADGLAGAPLTCAAYRNRRMTRHIARWTAKRPFDVALAFSSSMAPYALAAPAARHVLDLCDCDSRKWVDYARHSRFPASALWRLEAARLRGFELECLRRFDATLVITERERRILDPDDACPRLHVVANGVDLPAPGHNAPPANNAKPIIGFVGSMDYKPNVDAVRWFVRRVWPFIRDEIPEARFRIVGRSPTRAVRRLRRVPGVDVAGAVRSVERHLASMRVFVAPLFIARGLPNKVLEAMALRRPVVATTAVASCLNCDPGRNILVADAADAFARKVTDLCRFDALCDGVAEAGFRCVAAGYSWAETLRRFEHATLKQPISYATAASPMPTSLPVTLIKAPVGSGVTGLDRPVFTEAGRAEPPPVRSVPQPAGLPQHTI